MQSRLGKRFLLELEEMSWREWHGLPTAGGLGTGFGTLKQISKH